LKGQMQAVIKEAKQQFVESRKVNEVERKAASF